MEFPNRNVQSQAAAPGAQPTAAGPVSANTNKRSKGDKNKLSRIATVVVTGAVAALLIALAALAFTGGDNREGKYVNADKLQAIFLNTGQVYFGNIVELNDKYFVVTNIYYLQTSGGNAAGGAANANTNVSLVKLGCELHEPFDQMVINRDQVTFWENLGDNGQVAKAVSTFKKQNPNGQKCADQSSSSSTDTTNRVQSAGSNNGSTTPTTNTGNDRP